MWIESKNLINSQNWSTEIYIKKVFLLTMGNNKNIWNKSRQV